MGWGEQKCKKTRVSPPGTLDIEILTPIPQAEKQGLSSKIFDPHHCVLLGLGLPLGLLSSESKREWNRKCTICLGPLLVLVPSLIYLEPFLSRVIPEQSPVRSGHYTQWSDQRAVTIFLPVQRQLSYYGNILLSKKRSIKEGTSTINERIKYASIGVYFSVIKTYLLKENF